MVAGTEEFTTSEKMLRARRATNARHFVLQILEQILWTNHKYFFDNEIWVMPILNITKF